MPDRTYEIILFGATGFTGQLTARRLAETVPDLRWALAGRNLAKLEAVRAGLPASAAAVPLIQADVTDPDSLRALAAQTRVVLTTVGPFVRYGAPLVAACAEAGTDYVDITGEPGFVAEMYRTHHETAAANGARIVHCCGFDSIPHDLGAWHCVQQLPRTGPIEVRGYVRAGGAMSGGTWNTVLTGMSEGRKFDMSGYKPTGPDRRAGGLKVGLHRTSLGGWGVPMPTVDPFIVMRSAQDLGYGPDFRYGHFARFKTTRYLVALGVGLGVAAVGAQIGPIRRWMGNLRPPGSGPTQEQMDNGWMKVDFLGTEGETAVHTRVSCGMDPGYSMTARMVAESALCLARDRDALDPEAVGVLTPARAMAEPLKRRLEAAGLVFEVISP